MILRADEARIRATTVLAEVFDKLVPLPVPLFYICKKNNIRVWAQKMNKLDALAFLDYAGTVGILLNSRIYTKRSSFSLAHELGHYFCGHLFSINEPTPKLRYIIDRVADVFAAELMMPHSLCTYRTWTVSALADTCGVSETAARIRLEEWRHVG